MTAVCRPRHNAVAVRLSGCTMLLQAGNDNQVTPDKGLAMLLAEMEGICADAKAVEARSDALLERGVRVALAGLERGL